MAAKYSLTESQIRAGEILQDLVDGLATVTVGDTLSAAVAAGQVFTAGGTAQTTQGSQTASLDIANPSGSGKTFKVIGFLIQLDISGPLTAEFVKDPTITGGTEQTGINHDVDSATEASAVVTSGVNIVSGGTVVSPRIFVKDVAPFLYQGPPFQLDAGSNVSVRITGQTLATINYTFNVTWIEQ